ncbi:hypothetical protein MKJ01_16565 [Chryseobacterium sp. SSA4.19]|uniref:hypothetical protein n=1 Tax=Chryseobacterium sp. SSA4.19 TaxID=2919915 RepID=UPI001F4EFF1B|nr:hypothetical protein [Chryseobacterium sp. SSA4.19]MCJ8155380.1 hypothetical protein [Chryseobacterium sp. SSA4.19]
MEEIYKGIIKYNKDLNDYGYFNLFTNNEEIYLKILHKGIGVFSNDSNFDNEKFEFKLSEQIKEKEKQNFIIKFPSEKPEHFYKLEIEKDLESISILLFISGYPGSVSLTV